MPNALQCVNPECAQTIEAGVKFCPFCRTEQRDLTQSASGREAVYPDPVTGRFGMEEEGYDSASFTARPLILRATESIWRADDPERPVLPGEPRPLVVADEQVMHLANTTKKLSAEDLLERTKTALFAGQVPVEVELRTVCWTSDLAQHRERLVASLGHHPASDLKLLFGVDYLGKWASIQLHIAFEPEPFRKSAADFFRLLGWLCIAGGIFLPFLMMFFRPMAASLLGNSTYYQLEESPQDLFGISAVSIIAGIILLNWAKHVARLERAEREAKLAARMARTFAVDDMRLFCSAMQEVYQEIVDDIVQKGGEVVRVTGGQGGFFDVAGLTQAAAPQRRSDASLGSV